MTLRKLLVPFGPTDAGQVALGMAFDLARTFQAHVEVLHVRADPQDAVPLLGEGVSGAMVEELISLTEKESTARAAEAGRLFEERRRRFEIPTAERPESERASARFLEVVGREDNVTVERGHLSDLIVVGRSGSAHDAMAASTLRAVLFESGRPVLLVPETARGCGRRIVIAWNDSAEAARSVHGALPFLVTAERVTVFTATSEKTAAESAHGLVEFLAWHRIDATVGSLGEARGSVGETLATAAAAADADMVVMGAYTHSRLRQLILGGVTRHMLDHAPMPVLMAH